MHSAAIFSSRQHLFCHLRVTIIISSRKEKIYLLLFLTPCSWASFLRAPVQHNRPPLPLTLMERAVCILNLLSLSRMEESAILLDTMGVIRMIWDSPTDGTPICHTLMRYPADTPSMSMVKVPLLVNETVLHFTVQHVATTTTVQENNFEGAIALDQPCSLFLISISGTPSVRKWWHSPFISHYFMWWGNLFYNE